MPATSPSRRAKVDAAREAWIRRLVDTSRRNNLLYFRDLRVGTLDLGGAREGAVDELLLGAKVGIGHLAPDDPKAGGRLKEIARKALSNLEERGLDTLYLAYGMATWPVDDGGRPPEAAVVLVPVAVEGRRPEALTLVRTGPPRPNLALLHALAEQGFDIEIDEDEEDALTILGRLQASVPLTGFEVRLRAVVGNFSFQKLAMVQDLRERGEAMAASDLVAALAGDPEARAELARRRVTVEPRELDAIPASAEFMPLDADSSQQAVVHAVARGSDGVIQGPPGCGKSQTIANIVATLVAQGRRVLFVAEKRAALEAVTKRLEATGLGHLSLDLHGATVSQRAVVGRIAEVLAAVRGAAEPDDADFNARFEDRRARLIAHDLFLHTPASPSGLSPYELQNALIESSVRSKTRWRGGDLARLDRASADRIGDLLDEAAGHRDLFMGQDPWASAVLDDGHAAQAALDAAAALAALLPEMEGAVQKLSADLQIAPPETVELVWRLLNLVNGTNEFLKGFDPAIFTEADGLVRDLRPMADGVISGLWASIANGPYRRARRRLLELARISNPSIEHVRQATTIAQGWRDLGAVARTVAIPTEFDRFWLPLNEAVSTLNQAIPAAGLTKATDAKGLVANLLAQEASARAVPRVRAVERDLDALGAAKTVEEIRQGAEGDWRALFRDAWLRSCDDALRINPDFAGFSGEAHERIAAEFRALDRKRVEVAALRVRRAHAEAAVAAMNAFPEQTDAIRAETQKRTRHKPLRRLMNEASDVLPALCPCWMASPLNVSQLLPADRALFDVVVFDEASQVLPEDAVCAILRGQRLVVAGDRHQLPPTTFFADGGEEEEESEVAGYQSLLDQVGSFLEPWPLLWHYRSRDERLIAFSNRAIYGDRLVTFPGVGGESCVSHVLVDSTTRDDEESSTAEVERVVDLVLAHAEAHPDVSLGVIAMGLKHAKRIEAALDRALDFRRDLEPFFDPKRPERFFVKNLEQVQGDERDAIVISVGYGKGADGRLPYRFGPLLYDGGERRLNVAVTRARRRMTVVSSFSHQDMDPARSKAKGVVLLREFLQFAATGGALASGERVPLDALQKDVLAALSARGVPLVPKHGVSGYRLDFAAADPAQADRFLLAIESDGPTYHAAPTARDRDRLRQDQLEAIGWRFHRLWSTEWALHREREIEAIVRAWEGPGEEVKTVEELAAPNVTVAERSEPPTIVRRDDIEDVPPSELDALVRWVVSGGLMTDDEIVDEVAERLGYARVGAKIARVVQSSIERVRV